MEVKNVVKNFLGNYVKKAEVLDDDNIFELGLVNSLFAMQLVSFLEEEFDISINNDELDIQNFKSIQAICDFVEKKIN